MTPALRRNVLCEPEDSATLPPIAAPRETPTVTDDDMRVMATATPPSGVSFSARVNAVTSVGPTNAPATNRARAVSGRDGAYDVTMVSALTATENVMKRAYSSESIREDNDQQRH